MKKGSQCESFFLHHLLPGGGFRCRKRPKYAPFSAGGNFRCRKTLFCAPKSVQSNFRCRKRPKYAPFSAGGNFRCRKTLFCAPEGKHFLPDRRNDLSGRMYTFMRGTYQPAGFFFVLKEFYGQTEFS